MGKKGEWSQGGFVNKKAPNTQKQSDEAKKGISIPKSEILTNIEKWKNTLVGYVLGDKPFYLHLKAYAGSLWRPKCSLEIHSRDNGYFFFKFGSSEECDRVL